MRRKESEGTRIRTLTGWEPVGVPHTSMVRPGGDAAAIGVLRSIGLAARLGASGMHDAGDLGLEAPDGQRGPSGLLNEQALARLVVATRAMVWAVHSRDRVRLLVSGDCPVLLGAIAAIAGDEHAHGWS